MLQSIRDGLSTHKWVMFSILGGIAATFVFWGGTNSLDFNGVNNQTAAEVDGVEIPASAATREWSEMQSNWARRFGTDIPPEQRVAMQQNIIDNLVLRKLV